MLQIRDEQFSAMSEAARGSFETRVTEHARRCFPTHCEQLGNDRLVAVVRRGVARASAYGIVSEYDVCRFLDATFSLGDRFETDVSLGWAVEILRDEHAGGPSDRVKRLGVYTREYLLRSCRDGSDARGVGEPC